MKWLENQPALTDIEKQELVSANIVLNVEYSADKNADKNTTEIWNNKWKKGGCQKNYTYFT